MIPSIQEPDFLRICYCLGVAEKDFPKGNLKEGIAYVKNGMIMFMNGYHLWITKANSFTEKALEGRGYTINNNPDVFVPDFKAGHSIRKIQELFEAAIAEGITDRETIISRIATNEEIRFALACTCDPLLNDERQVKNLQYRIYGRISYGDIYNIVNQICEHSQFFNNRKYREQTFYEYCIPIIDNLLASYNQNIADNSTKKR